MCGYKSLWVYSSTADCDVHTEGRGLYSVQRRLGAHLELIKELQFLFCKMQPTCGTQCYKILIETNSLFRLDLDWVAIRITTLAFKLARIKVALLMLQSVC